MLDLYDTFGCRWDPDRRVIEVPDAAHRLSDREAAILGALIAAGGDTVSREALARAAELGDDRAVDFAVRRLRGKIERDPSRPKILLTVHGAGYRLGVSRPESPVAQPTEALRLGDRSVDLTLGLVRGPLGEETLTTLQLAVLDALVRAGGAVVSRRELSRAAETAARSVDAAVVVLRRRLEPDPSAPRHLLTVRGVGYRLARELPRTNLPAPGPGLEHRDAERAEVDEALSSCRCVLLVGPPGVGKSALAEPVARVWIERIEGGAWWVDCASSTSAADAARAALSALGASCSGEPTSQLLAALAARPPLLLVLDDLDQAMDVAGLLAALVRRSSATILATTSRRLDVPHSRIVPIDGLPPPAAAALYRRTARDVGARSRVDEVGLDAFVRAVDGLPLAIVLAARHADAIPPTAELAGPDGLEALAVDPSAGRAASIRATLDRAWARCAPEERRALRVCAVFLDPFPAEAAAAVGRVRRATLEDLVSRSLLVPVADGRRRFRLLGLVRTYVLEQTAPSSELRAAHASWFAACARRIADRWRTSADEESLAWLVGSPHDLEAAAAAGDERDALAIVRVYAMDVLWEAFPWLVARAEALAASDDPQVRGCAQLCRGWLGIVSDDYVVAEAALREAEAAGADATWVQRGRWEIATRYGSHAGPTWPCPVDPLGEIDWLVRSGWAAVRRGEIVAGREEIRRSEVLARRRGDRVGTANALTALARSWHADPARAAELYERVVCESLREERSRVAFAALGAAQCWARVGRLARADEHVSDALAAAEAVGNERLGVFARYVRVRLALTDGDPDALIDELEQLRAILAGARWTDPGFLWFLQALLETRRKRFPDPPSDPRDTLWIELWAALGGAPIPSADELWKIDAWSVAEIVRAHRTGAPLPAHLRDRAHRDPLLRLVRTVLDSRPPAQGAQTEGDALGLV